MEIQLLFEKHKKPVAPRVMVGDNMMGVMNHFYDGPMEGVPKPLKYIGGISRLYPGPLGGCRP